ncbi:hypothetical protein Q9L58_001874 [Maublancomyces gigas]|uniref:Uncharacterized protein n=1 Tax=Discina gigas TaxID=1032678 RepID=A0ABR3GST1_9PEZI
MKTRTVTFRLQVPCKSDHAGAAHEYASVLASSIKLILESRLPTIADGPATATRSVPLQVLIIVEPKREMTLEQGPYELADLPIMCAVVGGFLWVVCWILRAFAGLFAFCTLFF